MASAAVGGNARTTKSLAVRATRAVLEQTVTLKAANGAQTGEHLASTEAGPRLSVTAQIPNSKERLNSFALPWQRGILLTGNPLLHARAIFSFRSLWRRRPTNGYSLLPLSYHFSKSDQRLNTSTGSMFHVFAC
jgi:hypothetical protein